MTADIIKFGDEGTPEKPTLGAVFISEEIAKILHAEGETVLKVYDDNSSAEIENDYEFDNCCAYAYEGELHYAILKEKE